LLVSLRDTRIEEDSDNNTSSKDLLVRNVFEGLFTRDIEAREKESNPKNIPHEEVFRGIIFF
jgi:hypothetical protein